jgi:hypothetical protein
VALLEALKSAPKEAVEYWAESVRSFLALDCLDFLLDKKRAGFEAVRETAFWLIRKVTNKPASTIPQVEWSAQIPP